MMAANKRSQQARLYPGIPLFIVNLFQSLSSSVVAGIMFYFIAHLNGGHWGIPWMFYFLQGAALATIISLIALSIWNCFRPPYPLFNMIISAVLFVVWAVGFGLLANAMSPTLLRPCTSGYWGDSSGVNICIMYKALFASAAVGLASTIGALILDISATKKARRNGRRHENETLLAKGVGGTRYMPVWGEENTTAAVRTG